MISISTMMRFCVSAEFDLLVVVTRENIRWCSLGVQGP